jgi:hypothetical protein
MDAISTLTLYLEDDDTVNAVTSGPFDVCISLASTSGRVISQTKSASFTVRRFGSLDPLVKKLSSTPVDSGNGGAVAGAVIGILIGVCCLCTICTVIVLILVLVSHKLKKRTPVKQEHVQEIPLEQIVSSGYSQLEPSPETLSPTSYDPTPLPVIYDVPEQQEQTVLDLQVAPEQSITPESVQLEEPAAQEEEHTQNILPDE